MMKKLKKDIREVRKDIKRLSHKVTDPFVTYIWERCHIVKEICRRIYISCKSTMDDRTAPVDIAQCVLKKNNNVIEVEFRRIGA